MLKAVAYARERRAGIDAQTAKDKALAPLLERIETALSKRPCTAKLLDELEESFESTQKAYEELKRGLEKNKRGLASLQNIEAVLTEQLNVLRAAPLPPNQIDRFLDETGRRITKR